MELEELDLSIITGKEGCFDYYSLSEFTEYLDAKLSSEEYRYGRVFWKPERDPQQSEYHELCNVTLRSIIKEKILRIMIHLASSWNESNLIQFWAPTEDCRCLQTSDQPFSISHHRKGLCWYRKKCMEEGGREEQLGPVGRAYRNKHPESTPDLRLYSSQEFTLRDFAARCGLRSYLALPVFDLTNGECYGVLEVSFFRTGFSGSDVLRLVEALEVVELRTTHVDFLPIDEDGEMLAKYELPMDSEISKMLELAIKAVPQLNFAQVWVPCKQCSNTSNDLSCMERAAFTSAENGMNELDTDDSYRCEYLQACEFHNLQIGKGIGAAVISSNRICLCQNICDFGITENPLAHYAQRARLSIRIALCLKSVHNCNDLYIIEFFLQSNCREDACGGTFLNLLLRIMEMELKSFKVAKGEQLGDELLVEFRQPNAIGYDSILCVQQRNHHQSEELNILVAMEGYEETYSESEFTLYMQTENLCFQQLSEWYFCSPEREKLSENDFNSNSTLVHSPIKEKIELLMKKIQTEYLIGEENGLVQFWAPEINASRRCLSTSDQPFVLDHLYKGLALFRKQCMKHLYFVDERAKEEELGPPGRIFRNKHPEATHDLFLYSTKEFSLRNQAACCGLRKYIAFPVVDKDQGNCVGVLEFVLLSFDVFESLDIEKMLEAVGLSSPHANLMAPSLKNRLTWSVDIRQKVALDEIKSAFDLVRQIPQLYLAEVWVPNNEYAHISHNHSYMELKLSPDFRWDFCLTMFEIRHVQTRKGMVGMALASENKSCFCRNSCYFRIVEQDRAHFEQQERLDVRFAICLQSSHTGDLLYVLEFFFNQGPSNYEYFLSILPFILSILKQKLKSFKVASGQQLGEELVVEVIEFSEANTLTFSELDQQNTFPLKFKVVQYGQKEHQSSEDQQVQYVSHGMDSVISYAHEKQCDYAAANTEKEGSAKKTERGKRKTGLHLNPESLKPHFGKRLNDVAEELGVARSTIKRACRSFGIGRWPCNEKQKKNSSLHETESADNVLLDTPVDQNVPQPESESTQHVTAEPENEKIIIKAKYKDDIVKFELCLSSGLDKILEEVGMRLKLKMGSFKLKYLDEDNDEILLACDVDLQLCLKSFRAAGKACLQLFVQLNPNKLLE